MAKVYCGHPVFSHTQNVPKRIKEHLILKPIHITGIEVNA